MVKKTKLRPRRLFYDDKNNRYFYLINKKKKFINIGQIVSQKQISKINIQNIIPIKTRRKRIRKASEVKPITNQQIVTRLIPIAPVSANLSESRLFKGQEIEDKKKVEEEKKKIEELKKKSEEEKKSFTDSIKKLDEEKQKIQDDNKKIVSEIKRLDEEKKKSEEIQRLNAIRLEAGILKEEKNKLEKQQKVIDADLKRIDDDKKKVQVIFKQEFDRLNEIKRERDIIEDARKQSIRLQNAELTRRESELKKQEDETRKIKQQTLLERMEQLNQRATPTLSESESSTPTRIPKPSKPPSPSVPVLETDRIINFMTPEIDLTPEPVNIEEANEGDIGYETKDEEDDGEGESKEDTTIMETKEEKPIKKALPGIKKKLESIVKNEYAGNFNYPEFINWWENSKYGKYKTPSQNQFNIASITDLYEMLGYSSQAEMDNAGAEEIRKRREQMYAEAPYVMSSTATNTGRGNYTNDNDGIYNDELQKIFSDKTNKFLPVIASDKMDTLLKLVDNDTKKFAWIQNSENSKSMGRHWVAYFIDIPNLEINYFDSLVENGGEPTKQSLKGLKKIIDKINPEYYLKLKTNSVMLQNIKSSNCGYFALKFIMDRYRNIPFRTATMYDKITGYKSDDDVIEGDGEGEQMISKFKRYL